MNTGVSSEFPESRSWRELYQAAILELDATKLPHRIAEAEAIIVERARELFHKTGDNIEEQWKLDDAMRALRALRSTLTRDFHAKAS